MTTTYTSLLGLALPVTGELSGAWGDTVNNSITSLLDSAISGTTTISADADITLTTTTGAANEAREAILLWTAGGTVTRNITAPAQSKTYIVINKSSSTQSIVLRGVGPTTGVTIVQGESAVCAWNGTDFIKVSNISGAGSFTNLSYTGTLTGGTGIVNLGSGQFYKDASGNVGIGTSSPTQKLDVYGGAGAAVSIVRAAAGQNAFFSVAGNGNSFLSTSFDIVQDSTNLAQIAQRANAAMAFSTNNTERMRIDSSGNVGIGTSSPAYKLEVRSTMAVLDGSANIGFWANGTSYTQVWQTLQSVNDFIIQTAASKYMSFGTNSTERMRISSTGGLSVGTTSDPGAGAIYATGNITAFFSDDRLKTKLGVIQDALAKVKTLSGFYYEPNQTAQDLGYEAIREVGVSAQQVQAIMPEVVAPAPIDEKYLTVRYEKLIPLLIEAIKELDAKIDGLVEKCR